MVQSFVIPSSPLHYVFLMPDTLWLFTSTAYQFMYAVICGEVITFLSIYYPAL